MIRLWWRRCVAVVGLAAVGYLFVMYRREKQPHRSPLLEAADIPAVSMLRRIGRHLPGRRSRAAPAPSIQDAALGDPHTFHLTEEGSGAFGRWALDREGLPAYRYKMNQRRDVRAFYINSEGRDRRDHWHQIGNHRVTGLASNDGVIQLYVADRGGIFLNHLEAYGGDPHNTLLGLLDTLLRWLVYWYGRLRSYWIRYRARKAKTPRGATAKPESWEKIDCDDEPDRFDFSGDLDYLTSKADHERFAFSGGFGYLNDGDKTWATAYRYCPYGAKTRRVFGMGYYETEIIHRDIRQTRWVYAPYGKDDSHDYGNDPVLLVDVEIENCREKAVDLRYYEYWDVNIHQLQVQWIRTGLAAPHGNSSRALINKRFSPIMEFIDWQRNNEVLRFHQERDKSATLADDEQRGEIDSQPVGVFLANLSIPTTAQYVDKRAFFGVGGVRIPDAVHHPLNDIVEATLVDGKLMPYCMVLRHDLHLEPGAKIRLRYAYGAARPDESLGFLKAYRQGDWLKQTLEAWKKQLAYFTTGRDLTLQREMAWHSYSLLSSTLYSEYYAGGTHYIPQGSAYLYLHGADGVPRDQALFTLPLVYVCPALARETLCLLMSLRHADTLELPYAFVGNGCHSNAMGAHAAPSDLDLFFLLAISEYLAATGEIDFLNVDVPFYPPSSKPTAVPGITVLDHVRAAMKHLVESVGIGDHKLLKIRDGDWDDSVVIETWLRNLGRISRKNTICHGESVPNSQMAIYVLPLTASLIEKHDPELAMQMRSLAEELKHAVQQQWNKERGWFNRALLRDVSNKVVVLNDNHISLQSQPWALISGLAAKMGVEATLIQSIGTLDDPSPTGAMLATGGQVWPAVSQLLTWGYMRSRPGLAWRSLNRHSFAAHATIFPNVWFNIWSGPDGTNSNKSPNPGGAWTSPLTPMTDFPVMNANQDAMALLGLLRVCGIEPSPIGDGLIIEPKAPPESFVLDLPLLRLDVTPGSIAGEYRAVVDGTHALHVRLPPTAVNVTARIDEQQLLNGTSPGTGEVPLPITFKAGQTVKFSVQWTL